MDILEEYEVYKGYTLNSSNILNDKLRFNIKIWPWARRSIILAREIPRTTLFIELSSKMVFANLTTSEPPDDVSNETKRIVA